MLFNKSGFIILVSMIFTLSDVFILCKWLLRHPVVFAFTGGKGFRADEQQVGQGADL
jgi:hypothetical protein